MCISFLSKNPRIYAKKLMSGHQISVPNVLVIVNLLMTLQKWACPLSNKPSVLQCILTNFNKASDTLVNIDKSHVFFFITPREIQTRISQILSFHRSSLMSKYLGILLIDNALWNSSLEDFLSSLEKWLNSWTFNSLNLSSYLVLLKSILL